GVSRRKNDQLNLLSTTSPPSSGCLELEKSGNLDSSATAGSSNESVPGKNRLPAMPCASAKRGAAAIGSTIRKGPASDRANRVVASGIMSGLSWPGTALSQYHPNARLYVANPPHCLECFSGRRYPCAALTTAPA